MSKEQLDIILERSKNNLCPICTCNNHMIMQEVSYKGKKVFVCKKHLKGNK